MSPNLPIKSSSRAGRFKKKLVSEEFLVLEAPVIEANMAPFLDLFHQKKITDEEFTTLYIITVLSHRFPGTWLGSLRPQNLSTHAMTYPLSELKKKWEFNIQRRLEGFETLGDILANFSLRSTPLTVNRSLLSWSNGHYGLELMFRIPTPAEVLGQQKQGRRCVTIVLEAHKARKYILGERDALSFTMHDLIHADHFYHNNSSYQGQLGFYGFLDHCLKQGHFEEHLKHEKFTSEFEYLIADMNAYAIHLMKCFKSALIHYHETGEAFFKGWLSGLLLTNEEKEAFMVLNTSEHIPHSHDGVLLNFLEKFVHKV